MQSPFESLPEKVKEEIYWTRVSVVKARTDMINVWSLCRIRQRSVNKKDNLDIKTEKTSCEKNAIFNHLPHSLASDLPGPVYAVYSVAHCSGLLQ